MITMTEKDTVAFLENNILCFVCPVDYDRNKPEVIDTDKAFFTIRCKPKLPEFFEVFIVDYELVVKPELRQDELLFDLILPIFFDGEFIHTAHTRMMFHAAVPTKAKVISITLDTVMRNFG